MDGEGGRVYEILQEIIYLRSIVEFNPA